MHSLTERQKIILKGVIESHIETSEPVGSRYITDHCSLSFSPATIRNEMGLLEEMGYLTHPHTSSGRIPTDDGYRFYIDHTAFNEPLPEGVYRRLAGELDPRRLELNAIETFLDRVSSLLSSMTQEVGLSLAMTPEQELARKIDELKFSLQGLVHILEKPEFHDLQKMRSLLRTLEEKIALKQWLLNKTREARVSVSVGCENGQEALDDCSIVTARYSVQGKAAGVIAILGPKRMPYRQVVPLVSCVANIMSGFYSSEEREDA